MKLRIDRNVFTKSWTMAEKVVNPKSPIEALKGVYCDARDGKVRLVANDLKTGIELIANGVTVLEPGDAILPCSSFGELIKKAPEQDVELTIKECKGTLKSGKNKYRISTLPTTDYPKLPTSENAQPYFRCDRTDLLDAVAGGNSASSEGDKFPKYLGCVLFKSKPDKVDITATDGRVLSLAHIVPETIDSKEREAIIPLSSIKELQRMLSSTKDDHTVDVLLDGSTMFVSMEGVSLNMRTVESTFPNYERILGITPQLTIKVGRHSLIAALDRIDILVKSTNRASYWFLDRKDGPIHLVGRSPDMGEGAEDVEVEDYNGDGFIAGFNVGLIVNALSAFKGQFVTMRFAGPEGPLHITEEVSSLLYMVMPRKVNPGEAEDVV